MSSYSSNPPPRRSTEDTPTPTVCPACQSSAIVTTAEAPDADSYWRCEKCGEIWNAARSKRPNRYGDPRWR